MKKVIIGLLILIIIGLGGGYYFWGGNLGCEGKTYSPPQADRVLENKYSANEVISKAKSLGYRVDGGEDSNKLVIFKNFESDSMMYGGDNTMYISITRPYSASPNGDVYVLASKNYCNDSNKTLTKKFKLFLNELGIENQWLDNVKFETQSPPGFMG